MSDWDLDERNINKHWIDVQPEQTSVTLPSRMMPLHYKEDFQKNIDVFKKKTENTLS